MAQGVNEHLTKKIEDRDWRRICLRWIDHVPDFAAPGIPPELPLAEMPAVSGAVAAAPQRNFSYITNDVDGVRQGMLHESIYIFHKSAHIFGSSMLQVQHGMCTWSTSCAYQAAYFAAKAIVSMLGAVIVEPHSIGTGLLDVWHTPNKTRRRDPEPVVRVYRCGGDTSHPQLWAFLQQALKKTANVSDFCDQQLKLGILDIEPTDFARQRNDLHYRNTEWSGDDLHACTVKDHFGRFTGWALDHEKDDFLLLLCFSLIHVGQTMLSQLAQSSKVIEAEKSLVDVWLSQPFARLYRDNLAALVPPAAI